MDALIQFYQQLKYQAQDANHRRLFCLQGDQDWCIDQATNIIEHDTSGYHWCGASPSSVETCTASSLLGQNVQLLILNMHAGFDANMFASAEGSVCAGSVILILLPRDIIESDHFTRYIINQLERHQLPILIENHVVPILDSLKTAPTSNHQLNLTEQKLAIEQIIKTVKGHRRRPLVLTANRGRGKSAALGIAAASLINQGAKKIIVCAPNKVATSTLYKHASLTLTNTEDLKYLIFISPDTLAIEQPPCELLIIDEAAAIPIKLLTLFSKLYSRLVFSTTQFGYEGSGRGFALRFQKQLKQIAPEYRKLHLTQPIRWSENDPVENFTLSSLCLVEQATNKTIKIQSPTIAALTQRELMQQPKKLNQLFSLLVNAHYQTKPSDLVALLNDQNLTIFTMQQDDQILAVVLINNEGGFDEFTSEQIYLGKRRPNGHLIAQSLTYHSGFKQAASQHYARIQRIAVQPELQQQGLGSQLLKWVADWANQEKFDHLCASFAGSDAILRFWLRHDLQVLRIGSQKDKSSGEHSFMVNMPLSTKGKKLHEQIQTDFNKQVKVQLSRQLSHLDSSLIAILWPQLSLNQPTVQTKALLTAYTDANRSYENIEYLLIDLLTSSSINLLSHKQQYCLIEKVIQNHSWQEIVQRHHFTGQKQAQAFLKNCICDLLAQPLVSP